MTDNRKPKFGISTWSYPWAVGVTKGPRLAKRLSVFDVLENARELGVELIQYADNLPLEELPWETLVKLKRIAHDYGIHMEVGTKGTEPRHLRKFLEIANYLHSPILRTLPALFGDHVPLGQIEQNLIEVLPDFEKEGVVITLENQEAYRSEELAGLMEKINHPNLRICLDLANALGAMEGPEHVMSHLGPWCGNFHLKDVMVTRSQNLMEFLVEGRPAGQGKLPVKWALERLKEYGVEHTTILELWPPWQGHIDSTVKLEREWVGQSVNYMKTLFPG